MSRYYVLCAIIIAHHKLDDQIRALERVNIYRQSLMISLQHFDYTNKVFGEF